MPDTLQLGTFDQAIPSSGRFTSLLDLNDGVSFSLVRDTLTINPLANETATYAQSGRRYGGAEEVGVAHGNGVLEAEWYINSPTATQDAVLANFDKLAQYTQDGAGGPYFLRFKPENATKSIYYRIMGTPPYEPQYRWIEVSQTRTLHVKVSYQIAPLGQGDALDIYDSFPSNTLSDYTAGLGGGTLSWSSAGVVAVTSTATKLYQHTARGYTFADTTNTFVFKTGASAAGTARVILTYLDANNYLFAEQTGTTLRIGKRDAGTESTLGGTTAFTMLASTTYWLRLHKEGNALLAEIFNAPPSPMPDATATASTSTTLAGADATKFGVNIRGGNAFYLTPAATDWQVNAFNVEPYTYKNSTLPAVLTLPGIPGTAPALCDLYVTPKSTNGDLFRWFMSAWTAAPAVGAKPAPFGVFEAEAATNLTGFAVTADATCRGGSKLLASTPTSTMRFYTEVDPSLLVPDDYSAGEVAIELWARVRIAATVISPTITVWAINSQAATSVPVSQRYTNEFGNIGYVTPAWANVWRITKLGTLMLPVTKGGQTWKIAFDALGAVGSTGNFEVDYLMMNRARSRALMQTGIAPSTSIRDFSYFTSGQNTRLIRSDLSGYTAMAASPSGIGPYTRDVGLGGQLPEFPPGDVQTLTKATLTMPDDPTTSGNSEVANYAIAAIHYGITPRYHLFRSS
jgi:hypothetical protein